MLFFYDFHIRKMKRGIRKIYLLCIHNKVSGYLWIIYGRLMHNVFLIGLYRNHV